MNGVVKPNIRMEVVDDSGGLNMDLKVIKCKHYFNTIDVKYVSEGYNPYGGLEYDIQVGLVCNTLELWYNTEEDRDKVLKKILEAI